MQPNPTRHPRQAGRRFAPSAALFFLFAALLVAPRARSAPVRPVYTIAVGHNAIADALKPSAGALSTLRYADDDALNFYSLMRHASRRAFLLTVLDSDTQRRFPELAQQAAPPSLAELERVVALVAQAVAKDRAEGAEPEVVFFFSGHGVTDANGSASLSLLDGALTRHWLYEVLLARTPARFIHLIVDACHAEAFVRPRDVDARVEPVDPKERENYIDSATLARFPNVGAVLASTSRAQSFEWDAYRSGVFAHQLLSGLRGGADVNGDGRVEYSEIAAFLSAANLRVSDPRARLEIVVIPPRIDRRAPLLEFGALGRQFELRGRALGAWTQGFFVETEAGDRLLDVFPEKGALLALRLPIGERLYLIRPDGEVDLGVHAGGVVALASLRRRAPHARARGSLDSALRQGLFAARFGPAFYQGYVSEREELVPVPLLSESTDPTRDAGPLSDERSTSPSSRRTVPTALLVSGGVAAVVSGLFASLALKARNDYESTHLERPARQASDAFHSYRSLGIVSGAAALALAGTGVVLLAWPTQDGKARARLTLDGIALAAQGAF